MTTPNGDPDPWPGPVGPDARRSVLADDLVVEGDITSGGPVDVRGQVVGSLHAPTVVVADIGRVEGTIHAHDLSVHGAVSGTISARMVQLASSAVVHADVLYERIAIAAGAVLDGRLQHKG